MDFEEQLRERLQKLPIPLLLVEKVIEVVLKMMEKEKENENASTKTKSVS